MSIAENQLKNLRRRMEHFIRNTTSENMIKIAEFLNEHMKAEIKIPKLLKDRFSKRNKE